MPTKNHPWLGVTCPTCKAQPGDRCRSRYNKVTEPHLPRLEAAIPPPTEAERIERAHQHNQHVAQFSNHTLVRTAVAYSCGCGTDYDEPIPLADANVYGVARAIICDVHQEYAVVTALTTRLVADEDTILRVLMAAGVDEDTARYVAIDQNDDARMKRAQQGLGMGPS